MRKDPLALSETPDASILILENARLPVKKRVLATQKRANLLVFIVGRHQVYAYRAYDTVFLFNITLNQDEIAYLGLGLRLARLTLK